MWKLPPPPERLRRAWPHLRAALIFGHLAAVLVMCLPAPYKMASRQQWRTAQAKTELASWAARLRSAGIDTSAEELEAHLFGLTRSYLRLRSRVNRPFERYHRVAEMRQGWSMFSHPQTHPGWLHVEVREPNSADYRPVYVQRSRRHTWRRDQFEHNRLRKLIGRISRRPPGHPSYRQLADWIARKAAMDFPRASHVRVRMFRARTYKPGRGTPPPGKFTDQRIYSLERLR